MQFQINTVKYDDNQEIMNTYENLQIVWSEFLTDKLLFVYIQSNSHIIGLLVFRFNANKHKRRAIQLHSTIRNIRSPIGRVITKII